MPQHQLDARRLLCPMPVIRTETKVADLNPGDRLEVLCTDRGALHDIPAWCRVNGHRFVASHEADGVISIIVEVLDS
jgi:tRNA 2-thiouridine synthesizing protein A